jgi:hypothetical protein
MMCLQPLSKKTHQIQTTLKTLMYTNYSDTQNLQHHEKLLISETKKKYFTWVPKVNDPLSFFFYDNKKANERKAEPSSINYDEVIQHRFN